MRRNLSARVEALEAKSPTGSELLLVVGPYRSGDDPAPHIAQARARWFAYHGDFPPNDVRVLHVELHGLAPEGANDAR